MTLQPNSPASRLGRCQRRVIPTVIIHSGLVLSRPCASQAVWERVVRVLPGQGLQWVTSRARVQQVFPCRSSQKSSAQNEVNHLREVLQPAVEAKLRQRRQTDRIGPPTHRRPVQHPARQDGHSPTTVAVQTQCHRHSTSHHDLACFHEQLRACSFQTTSEIYRQHRPDARLHRNTRVNPLCRKDLLQPLASCLGVRPRNHGHLLTGKTGDNHRMVVEVQTECR